MLARKQPLRRRARMTVKLSRRKGTEARRTARKNDAEKQHRQAVKAAIWAVRMSCQLCRGSRWRECVAPDQMHEDPSRAKTRGLPPEDRFNERVCGRVCEACHRDVTQNRLRVVFADEYLRFRGRVWAVQLVGVRQTGEVA